MKTREDFLAAANEAYRVYEKFKFKAATDIFGIAEPTHEKVPAFPNAHKVSDFHLWVAGRNFSNILMTGHEVYVPAVGNTQELLGGLFDLQGRWIAWSSEPTDLPKQVRLGDLTMVAEWSVLLRYVYDDTERVQAIAGVELGCWEPEGSRAQHQSLYDQVSAAMGAPLARYDATASPGLPARLLWTGKTVAAELDCMQFPPNPDDDTPGYRSYKLKISRKTNEDATSAFGVKAERLLKE